MISKSSFTVADFERMFHYESGSIPKFIIPELLQIDSTYHFALSDEITEYVANLEMLISSPKIERSREETYAAFEKGWSENYNRLISEGVSLEALKPGYFRGSKFLRFQKRIIVSQNDQLEFDLFKIARLLIFSKFLQGQEIIWELGCGSCENLLMLSDLFPTAELHGADWTRASEKIANHLGRVLQKKISGTVFDMNDISHAPHIRPGCALLSIHAFEQLGCSFHDILHYLIRYKPSLVVQYEPVLEFYDSSNLYDNLAIRYCLKRNYLNGYFSALQQLENAGEIQILAAFRPELGGVLHESSLIVWKPVS